MRRPQTCRSDGCHRRIRRRPPRFLVCDRPRFTTGRLRISQVISVEVPAADAFSLAARLSSASSERFRCEVIVHAGGLSEVLVTATDVSAGLTKALLSALRDFLVEQRLETARLHLDGRDYVLSTQPA